MARFHHLLQYLPISEGVHWPPEALVFISHEMAAFDQTGKRLNHQFLAFPDKIEDPVAENEISAVDPNVGMLARAKPSHFILLIKTPREGS